jgi:HAMP domain-containing protein
MYDLGKASSLLYDTDAESYLASVAISSAVPAANEALDQARAYGSSFKGTRLGSRSLREATQPERDFMVAEVSQIQSSAAALNRELASAIAADPKLGGRLKPLLAAADDARNQFISTIEDELNNDSAVKRDATQFFEEATKAIDAQVAVSTASSGVIQGILSQRVTTTSQARAFSTGSTLAGVAVAGLLILIVGQGITRRIGRLVNVADGISLGELDAEIDVQGDDEIGELAESIRRMQSSLQAAIGRLRARRASA